MVVDISQLEKIGSAKAGKRDALSYFNNFVFNVTGKESWNKYYDKEGFGEFPKLLYVQAFNAEAARLMSQVVELNREDENMQ